MGVDGLTQSANNFRSQTMKLKWEQNVATKTFWHVYHGAFIAYRLVRNKEYVEDPGKYKGLISFRNRLNGFMSMGDFVEEAMKDLLLRAQELSGGKAVPSTSQGAQVDGASGVAGSQILR